MKKAILLAAVAALFVSMLVIPASAASPNAEAGVLQGVATVGRASTGCAKDGVATVSGRGLYLPGVDDANPGYWHFKTTTVSVPRTLGALEACGDLGPAPVLGGAACGSSSGSGKGTLSGGLTPAAQFTLGWPATVGGTLPITGTAEDAATKTKAGALVAVVQAQGGSDCVLNPNGAQAFNVVGVFAAFVN